MRIYHAVAVERGEDGTQLIDLGTYSCMKYARQRISDALDEVKRDFPRMHISRAGMCAREGSSYEWVASIFPIDVLVRMEVQG